MTPNLPPEDQLTGNGGDPSVDLTWVDGETEEDYVAKVNEATGRKFSSMSDIVKNIQNADKKIAELGRSAGSPGITPTPQSTSDVEAVFFESKPEAEKVADLLNQVAQATGKSKIQAWRENPWIQERAKSLFQEEERARRDAKKMLPPSGSGAGSREYKEYTDDEIMDLPPEEAAKAIRAKAGKL